MEQSRLQMVATCSVSARGNRTMERTAERIYLIMCSHPCVFHSSFFTPSSNFGFVPIYSFIATSLSGNVGCE